MKKLLSIAIAFIAVMTPILCFAAGPSFSISVAGNTDSASPLVVISLDGMNLDDLYAYEAVISFDSEKLELVKTVSELKGFSVSPKIEGNRAYIAFTKVGNTAGENGNVKLSTIIFRGKESGKAKIRLESVKTVDSKLSAKTYKPGKEISVSVRRIGLVLEPTVDGKSGAAIAVLSEEQIKDLLSKTEYDSSGIRTMEIEVLKAGDAQEYILKFPVLALSNPLAKNRFAIRTPFGTVRVPGNLLAKVPVENEEYALIRISGKAGDLNSKLWDQTGNRPVISLQVDVGGKTIRNSNPGAQIGVTLPYRPTVEEAADPEHIVVMRIDGEGNAIPVETGVYSDQQKNVGFVTNHLGTFTVSFVKKTFEDVINHWSQKYVEVMASRGIIKGFPNNLFGYQYEITRADYVTLLVRMLGIYDTVESNFDDVKPEDYFYHTVGLARKAGIVKNNEKLFRPREPVTREEMMMFTAAALKYAVPGIGPANLEVLNGFSDADLVSPEARESAAILVENRIILGAGGKLMPREKMTRAEAATVLYRLFKLMWSE